MRLQKLFWEKIKYYCKLNFWNVICVTSCSPECNIPAFIVQFFTMHETLHTYRFWAFGEKTPSLLFMLHKEELLCFVKNPPYFVKHQCFVNNKSLLPHQEWWNCDFQLTLCLFYKALPKDRPRFQLMLLMWYDVWCDAMWDDVMIWCKKWC